MDQTYAQVGQEEAPEGQINATTPEESPVTTTGSMEKLLPEEGLNLDFPKQGEIRTGVIASIGENEILVSVGTKSEGVISGKEKEQIRAEAIASFQVPFCPCCLSPSLNRFASPNQMGKQTNHPTGKTLGRALPMSGNGTD